MGFVNFHWWFIKSFSDIVQPLTVLTCKGSMWSWSDQRHQVFDKLKVTFTTTLILTHFYWDKKILIEADVLDLTLTDVLLEYHNNDILHLVTFYSKKHFPAKANCYIYDKKLVAIVRSFEKRRTVLSSALHLVSVLSNHRNLEYLMSNKKPGQRQSW